MPTWPQHVEPVSWSPAMATKCRGGAGRLGCEACSSPFVGFWEVPEGKAGAIMATATCEKEPWTWRPGAELLCDFKPVSPFLSLGFPSCLTRATGTRLRVKQVGTRGSPLCLPSAETIKMLPRTPRPCQTRDLQAPSPRTPVCTTSLPAHTPQRQSQIEAPLWPVVGRLLSCCPTARVSLPLATPTALPASWELQALGSQGLSVPCVHGAVRSGPAEAHPPVTAKPRAESQAGPAGLGLAAPDSGPPLAGKLAGPLGRWGWLLRAFPTFSASPTSLYSCF